MPVEVERQWEALVKELSQLEPAAVDEKTGAIEPRIFPLSPKAKKAWMRFYNQHAAEQNEISGDLAAAWSKLEGYAARLALLV